MARSKLKPSALPLIAAAPRAPKAAASLSVGRTVIRIPKTAEVIATSIRKMIIRGEVNEGDFLQPEAQLMEHFGTSRPTIREAFRILENERLISVTRGSRSGARVHSPKVDSVARYAGFALQAQGTLLSDIYLARLCLEPVAARLAASARTPDQLAHARAELAKVFTLLEARGSNAPFRIAVVRLHQLIVEMSGSNTLTMISAMLQGVVEQHMGRFVQRLAPPNAEKGDKTRPPSGGLKSFSKLFDLIEAKDADGAEAHWRTHMRNANATWLEGYDRTALVDVLE